MAEIKYIPIRQLKPSDSNVRKAAGDKQAFKELKASIQTQGILQNLVVAPVADEPDTYEIHAGSRRYRAITELIDEGKVDASLAPDFLVPCLVEDDPEKLAAVSLAENICREGMHEVDELEAFSKLAIEHKYTIVQIASTFGKSQKYVRQVLALGACAPKLLEWCRSGNIAVETLRAFTLTKDHEKQLQAYEHVYAENYGHVHRHAVRQFLTKGKICSNDKLVKFVGANDYQKAGGTLEKDLFQDQSYLTDPQLLQKLAREKADQLVAEQGEGWAFVEIDFDADTYDLHCRPRLRGEPTSETEDIKAEIVVTRAEHDELEAKCDELFDSDEDNDEEFEKVDIQRDQVVDRLEELETKLESTYRFSEENRARSGIVVTIDAAGRPVIYAGILSDQQAKEAAKSGEAGNVTNLDRASAKDKPKYSPALIQDLKTYKTEVARLALVQNPEMATELLHFQITVQALAHGTGRLSIHLSATESDTARNDISANLARVERRLQLEQLIEQVDTDWQDKVTRMQYVEAFEDYCLWSDMTKNQVLAHAVALSLNIDNEFSGHLLKTTGVELPMYWRPTVDNFFSRINHQTCLECAADIMGETWAEEHAHLKKKDLAIRLEEECEVDQPGCWWIPDPMLTTASSEQELHEEDDADGIEEDQPLAAAAG